MQTTFILELYFENEGDRAFAEGEADELKCLVHLLAPHIDLKVEVVKATVIERIQFYYLGTSYDVPNHAPSVEGRQSLLITSENIGAQG
jgi:hypothetical protein